MELMKAATALSFCPASARGTLRRVLPFARRTLRLDCPQTPRQLPLPPSSFFHFLWLKLIPTFTVGISPLPKTRSFNGLPPLKKKKRQATRDNYQNATEPNQFNRHHYPLLPLLIRPYVAHHCSAIKASQAS